MVSSPRECVARGERGSAAAGVKGGLEGALGDKECGERKARGTVSCRKFRPLSDPISRPHKLFNDSMTHRWQALFELFRLVK